MRISLALFALFPLLPAAAAPRLAALFTEGAVLQRDREVRVWGSAEPHSTVTLRFGGQAKSTTASEDGSWGITLDPMPANAGGRTLEVRENDGEPLRVPGILVGEVWLASGQSNMEWPVRASREEDQQAAAAGAVENLRIFHVPNRLSDRLEREVDASWAPATPETVRDFSAVAYFFGRELGRELDVPIGIISAEWGGSRIEPWASMSAFGRIPELAELSEARLNRHPMAKAYREAVRAHLDATRAWIGSVEEALSQQRPTPEPPPAPPRLRRGHNADFGLFEGMIHPLIPYGLRGFLWYQGESNLADGLQYRHKLEGLVRNWRTLFTVPEAPFLYVQLAPFDYGGDREGQLPRFWCAQTAALELPHTGMAIINDIGNPTDIHPRNKSEVGRRLALLALADAYGRTGLVKSGPLMEGIERRGDELAVRFRHAGDGLRTRDGKAPDSFELAGDDGVFHPAAARIDGDRVILSSDAVAAPDQARFAWSQTASPNLVNSAGLPASCFHTRWPHDVELGPNLALGRPHVSSDPNRWNWDSGLTDGHWDGEAGRCFATGDAPEFPKHVTIELADPRELRAVRLGTPGYGSTRTVAVSLSRDGQDFEEVGRHEFGAKQEGRATLRFEARPARYVRATFLDHHPQQDHYDESFGFLRELEVYAEPD